MKVAVLSDIHSNIFALEAALIDCEAEAVDYFIVAGDLVGYYYWPQPVVRRLMHDARITCIRGNHEDILAETLKSHDAADRYRRKYGSGYDVCRESLSDDELDWLLQLPASAELILGGAHFSVHHGSPAAIDEYVYPDASVELLTRCHNGRDFTVLGHTHYPLMHDLDGRILLNPGSIGQARDFGGQACYAVIDMSTREVRFKRIAYDISLLVEAAKVRDPSLGYLHEILSRRAR